MTDHDRLFKELLATFFLDFLDPFAPDLAREVEPASLELLDKELFADLPSGEHHVVDLLARVRLRRESSGSGSSAGPLGVSTRRTQVEPTPGPGDAGRRPTYVLVHVETQAHPLRGFARRMFRYFASLELRHALPIYPIALFSHERPRSRQPGRFDLRLPGLHVLHFRFRTVQLNRLDWRDFLRRPNPVAAALMARMRIAPSERVHVKLECLKAVGHPEARPGKVAARVGFRGQLLAPDGRGAETVRQGGSGGARRGAG